MGINLPEPPEPLMVREDFGCIEEIRKKNLLHMQETAKGKCGHEMKQIESFEFSAKAKLLEDEIALQGKLIIQEKFN